MTTSQKTWVNTGSDHRKTWVNHGENQTVINPYASHSVPRRTSSRLISQETSVVPDDVLTLEKGTCFRTDNGSVYKVIRRLKEAEQSGEADVYLCRKDERQYVVKVYRRQMVVKPEMIESLKRLDSSLVAAILDIGTYEGRYFEVYEYYAAGSLADELKHRTFSYDELKRVIIPGMANGLYHLHHAGILHRDIKPENIMWLDHKKDCTVLIDFGLASIVRNSSLSILVSQVGCTLDYAAPEVLRKVYFELSDYYSMGIVIYELFCGKKPFANQAEAISFRVSQPEEMPDDLYHLILGLTYQDITLRHDVENPNRRWGYEEVWDWLEGKEVPVPGMVQVVETSTMKPEKPGAIPPFSFCEKTFTDIDSLCHAMCASWENARSIIMRGSLLQHFRQFGKTDEHGLIASTIDEIMNTVEYTTDQKVLRTIQRLSPNHAYIASPMGPQNSVENFGKHLMIALEQTNQMVHAQGVQSIQMLLSTEELTSFMQRIKCSKDMIQQIKQLENQVQTNVRKHDEESIAWEVGYLLSGSKKLDMHLPDGTVFLSLSDLTNYLMTRTGHDYRDLYETCEYFLEGSHQMKPQVFGWLRQFGCQLDDFNLAGGQK